MPARPDMTSESQATDSGYRIPVDILLAAYSEGIFPMAEDAGSDEIFWVRPERRGIIPLDTFHVPHSLAKKLRRKPFEIRYDSDFDGVIAGCAAARRTQSATWINQSPWSAIARIARKPSRPGTNPRWRLAARWPSRSRAMASTVPRVGPTVTAARYVGSPGLRQKANPG